MARGLKRFFGVDGHHTTIAKLRKPARDFKRPCGFNIGVHGVIQTAGEFLRQPRSLSG